MVDKARVEAQHHWFTYNERMSVESVARSVSNLALQFGEESSVSMVTVFQILLVYIILRTTFALYHHDIT